MGARGRLRVPYSERKKDNNRRLIRANASQKRWNAIFEGPKEKACQPVILYPAK